MKQRPKTINKMGGKTTLTTETINKLDYDFSVNNTALQDILIIRMEIRELIYFEVTVNRKGNVK